MNNIGMSVALAMCLYLQTSCSNDSRTFERPENVPHSAVAAIGPDGGSWADCKYIKTMKAQCVLFFSSSGNVRARGTYILKENDDFVDIETAAELAQLMMGFWLFDGKTIHLSEGRQLIPDGEIDFPFSIGGGKRTEYSKGVITRPAVQYD